MPDELEDGEKREVGRKARAAVLGAIKALGGEGTRAVILDRAVRDGGFTTPELAAPAPEAVRDQYESFVDYRLSWALSNLKRDGLLENPRWSVWCLAGAASEELRPLVAERVSSDRLAELRAMSEREYLRTPEWRRTRAAALERANYRCSLDRTHCDYLEVHHNTYERLGAELPADLVVLCRDCHRLHHKQNGRPRRPRTHEQASRLREAASFGPPARALPQTDVTSSGTDTSPKRSFLQRLVGRA